MLTHSLLTCYLASMYLNVFEGFFFKLRLISSFKSLWSEKVFDMISIFLNLLRLILCPTMWSIFENVPCALEMNVYSVALGRDVLSTSIKYIWSSVSFKVAVSWLIFLCRRSMHWWQWGVKISYNGRIAVNLFCKVHQGFLYIFKCSGFGYVCVYNGYILFLDWFL